MTISFIVPTIGRSTLMRTLASIEKWPGDEIYAIQHFPPSGTWGNAERKEGIAKAKGNYLAFIDDDDWYVQGHREIMENAIKKHPGRPILFRMQYPNGNVLWKEKEVVPGNVSSQMILVPNRKQMFYKFQFPGNTNMGDYYFISRWKFPEIIWREEILVRLGHNDKEVNQEGK